MAISFKIIININCYLLSNKTFTSLINFVYPAHAVFLFAALESTVGHNSGLQIIEKAYEDRELIKPFLCQI